ncbi:flavin-containing monooxygenase [Perlucidibaca piscinae]|uniref:flavin-containing monooxygenase n=1 Tax=Perlucidibaca piscinae TaxID=392589 RepID=UPI0003B5AE62|nr:NAD(P)/FAD-dependent oxidoreductase [Perlucidibaca piscinae]
MATQHQDILIVGAGLSGVGAACHLKRQCPGKSVTLLERRQNVGGTWDLFRYPGIRSDSDMYTFGFNFKPWTEPRVLADGDSIRNYVRETAKEFGVFDRIRFGRQVISADWSSRDALWTLQVRDDASDETETYTARYLLGCSGYYNYDQGFRPEFPGEADFKGQIIHPQFWPENLDYSGKRVVVIGSGATAITLVPSMADKAAHVTMLQRSPTYIMSVPAIDPVSKTLQAVLPEKLAYKLNRGRNVAIQRAIYEASRRKPEVVRRLILSLVARQLKGTSIEMRHFTPSYNPWDQRLCVVPNGDLFKALRSGKASMATDHIERFTEDGILLKSGETLKADIIITATGLSVQLFGGIKVSIDGKPVSVKDSVSYKGVLLEGIPNAALVFGYTNASWTLKADLAAEYFCRLVNYMDKHGHSTFQVPRIPDVHTEDTVLGSLSSGYIRRAADQLPRQGTRAPFRVEQNYLADIPMLRFRPIADDVLQFDGKVAKASPVERLAAPLRAALGR